MRFLSVGSHVCAPASFGPPLAETLLPLVRTFGSIHYHERHRFSYKGLSPHKFTPMAGVHKSFERECPALPDIPGLPLRPFRSTRQQKKEGQR